MQKLNFFTLALAAAVALAGSSPMWAADSDMKVVNNTGHTVVAFVFTDDKVHESEDGGVQFGTLTNGQSAVAHVPTCTFSVLLVDHEDVWHAEFHDCNARTLTFTATTGHGHHK